jgi:hypothetical protein
MSAQTSVSGDLLKAYLYTTTATLLDGANTKVYFGFPPAGFPDNTIAWTEIRSEVGTATQTPRRTRDEDVEVDFIISCALGGADVAEVTVSDLAYGYLRQIERLVRVTDPSLGGKAEWAFVTRYQSSGLDDPDAVAFGRVVEINGTISARIRIRD